MTRGWTTRQRHRVAATDLPHSFSKFGFPTNIFLTFAVLPRLTSLESTCVGVGVGVGGGVGVRVGADVGAGVDADVGAGVNACLL